jgi:hypothetical protein
MIFDAHTHVFGQLRGAVATGSVSSTSAAGKYTAAL